LALDKEAFKRMFPNLSKEMSSDENKVPINSVRTDSEDGEKHVTETRFANYSPDAIDFIRRCESIEQAEEIIAYLERRGEIDGPYAKKLRRQLKKEGLRSFGSKKEHDFYLKRRQP
jgi:hypothetical protein